MFVVGENYNGFTIILKKLFSLKKDIGIIKLNAI